MNHSNTKGLFMDLDGTLADSKATMRGVFRRFLRAKNIDASPDDFGGMRGKPLSALVEYLRLHHGYNCTEESLINDFYDLADEVYADESSPMPGARRLLRAASRGGVAVFIVTSARGTAARGFLERYELAAHVRGVVAAEDVSRSKPDPQPYRLALERAGLAPAQGLAVEDSLVGVRSAAGAGLATWIMAPEGRSEVSAGEPGVAGFVRSLIQIIPALGLKSDD